MSIRVLVAAAVMLQTCDGCSETTGANDAQPSACDAVVGATPDLGDAEEADYAVVFVTEWNARSHPLNFPADPHFSPLVAMTHPAGQPFFVPGGTASEGMEVMAERGPPSPLDDELAERIAQDEGFDITIGTRVDAPGSHQASIRATTDHASVTAVSMIAPSPDWFVAARDVALRDADGWLDAVRIPAAAYDAGTDDGETFEAADADTDPQATITRLDTLGVSGGTDPFAYWLFCRTG